MQTLSAHLGGQWGGITVFSLTKLTTLKTVDFTPYFRQVFPLWASLEASSNKLLVEKHRNSASVTCFITRFLVTSSDY